MPNTVFGRHTIPANNLCGPSKYVVRSEEQRICQNILCFELEAKTERERFWVENVAELLKALFNAFVVALPSGYCLLDFQHNEYV
jgi:hypothetical protein